MNFKTLSDLWLKDKKNYVRQSTIATYTFILNRFLLPEFGDMVSLRDDQVQSLVWSASKAGLSRNYIKGIVTVLRMILRYGRKSGFDADPQMEIHVQNTVRCPQPMSFNIKDQNVLMRYLRKNFTPDNIGIYMSLAFGLRIGEVCALKWRDLDLESGTINIKRTVQRVCLPGNVGKRTAIMTGPPKSLTSIREIPMTRQFIRLLEPVLDGKDKDCYVLSGSDAPMEPRSYRNHYRSLLRRLDLPGVKFHGLRHSFATRCIDGRCDYKTVSSILGHASISTTLNLYVHPNVDQKRECLEKMTCIFEDDDD